MSRTPSPESSSSARRDRSDSGKSVISSEPFAPRAVVLAGGTSDGCSPTLALDTSSTQTAIGCTEWRGGLRAGDGVSQRGAVGGLTARSTARFTVEIKPCICRQLPQPRDPAELVRNWRELLHLPILYFVNQIISQYCMDGSDEERNSAPQPAVQ